MEDGWESLPLNEQIRPTVRELLNYCIKRLSQLFFIFWQYSVLYTIAGIFFKPIKVLWTYNTRMEACGADFRTGLGGRIIFRGEQSSYKSSAIVSAFLEDRVGFTFSPQ